jgi:tRNA threonylcarbamoyladenosine biosynthesis protein TsaB
VILLALDTCDVKGSVALVRNDVVLSSANHDTDEEYSCWLLPAVHRLLKASGCSLPDVDAFAVACGPGSFTGVRIGLTTVKAWSEVFAKPVAAVSRLKAIAWKGAAGRKCIAAFANARRGQVFGAVYYQEEDGFKRAGDEMVIAPGEFIQIAVEQARGESLAWATPEADALIAAPEWREREKLGDELQIVSPFLADTIARLAEIEVAAGRATGSLELDANYVRRTDAEVHWKAGPLRGN